MANLKSKTLSLLSESNEEVQATGLFQLANDTYGGNNTQKTDPKVLAKLLDYFVDCENSEMSRRAAGFLLQALIIHSPAADNSLSTLSKPSLLSLGSTILSYQNDSLKFQAGLLLRSLANNLKLSALDIMAANGVDKLPKDLFVKSPEWMNIFDNFLEDLSTSGVIEQSTADVFWILNATADGIDLQLDTDQVMLTIRDDLIALISMTHQENLRFIEIPCSNVVTVTLAKDKIQSSTQMTSSQTSYSVLLGLVNELGASHNYLHNAQKCFAKMLTLRFTDFKMAKEFVATAKPTQKLSPKDTTRGNKEDTESNKLQDDRANRKPPVIHFSQDGPKNQGKRQPKDQTSPERATKFPKIGQPSTIKKQSEVLEDDDTDLLVSDHPIMMSPEPKMQPQRTYMSSRVDVNGSPHPNHAHVPLAQVQQTEFQSRQDWLDMSIRTTTSQPLPQGIPSGQGGWVIKDKEPLEEEIVDRKGVGQAIDGVMGSDDEDETLVDHPPEGNLYEADYGKSPSVPAAESETGSQASDQSSQTDAPGIASDESMQEQSQSEDLNVWEEATIHPHQEPLVEVLIQAKQKLLYFLGDAEAASTSIVEDYKKGGETLIHEFRAVCDAAVVQVAMELDIAKRCLAIQYQIVLNQLDADMADIDDLSKELDL